jgi:glycosyltransferase 2 family protein
MTSSRPGPQPGDHADLPAQAGWGPPVRAQAGPAAPAEQGEAAPAARAEQASDGPATQANPSPATQAGPGPPAQTGGAEDTALVVIDQRARRIRRPIDLLRCLVAALGIVVAAGIGLLAHATAAGVEIDAVGAGRRLPGAVLSLFAIVGALALVLLPAALAIRELSRRQPWQVAEALLTGAGTIGLIALANIGLRSGTAAPLYDAIAVSHHGAHVTGPLDGYLAGLAAYATIIGLSGPSRWRAGLWLAVGVYAVASLAQSKATVLSLLITLLFGRAVGLGVRYAAGSWSQRPGAEKIAAALASAGQAITAMRRTRTDGSESRHYAATVRSGDDLDVRVFDRDQEAAGAAYRLYRWVRLQGQVRRGMPLSLDRVVERQALLSYASDEAGVRTPRLRALVRVGADAVALANDHPTGTTLAELAAADGGQPTDAQLLQVWQAVLRLHAHRVTHRALTADHIMFADDGGVILLDPGTGDVAATDLQLRLDLAQLLAEMALLVGPDRTADLALKAVSADELVAVASVLQPIVLYRSTRTAIRHRKDVLPELRKQILAAAPGEDAAPVRLERVRLRTLVTLVASLIAGYLLIGELGRVSLLTTLRSADWRWTVPALALSAVTYIGAAWSLAGYVPERLRFAPLTLAQVAGSFVTLVTPAAVGGAALNIRYLQRRKVPPAVAGASVGLSQVVAFALHISLIIVFVAITGSQSHSLRPPTWVYFVIAALVAIVLLAIAIPAGRRLLTARLAPVLSQVLPRLLAVIQQPRKLAEGIGGSLLLTAAYILCLAACIRALGGSVPIASTAVVYLTGSALGSAVPTPGGIGAVEAALSAGLTAAGLPGATAVSAVLLFRLLTFWLPVPAGWAAFNYLERHQYL